MSDGPVTAPSRHGPRGRRLVRRAPIRVAAGILGVAVLAACGGGSATPTPVSVATPAPSTAVSTAPSAMAPSPGPTPSASAAPSAAPSLPASSAPASSAPASAAPSAAPSLPVPSTPAGPGASAAPTDPDLGVTPDRTLPPGMDDWPPSVVNATIALAAVDNEIKEASGDWAQGAQAQDMELLLSAAQGMAYLAGESIANAERLAAFPETQAVGAQLVDAYRAIQAAGSAVADAMLAGDGTAVQAAIVELQGAMEAYGTARPALIERAELALVMRRGLLVK